MPVHDFASQRLVVRGPLSAGATLALDTGQINYLLNVLRMEAGAKLLVFNGQDGEWLAELVQPSRKIAAIRAIERCARAALALRDHLRFCAVEIGPA